MSENEYFYHRPGQDDGTRQSDNSYRVGNDLDENDSKLPAILEVDHHHLNFTFREQVNRLEAKVDRLLEGQARMNSLLLMMTQIDPYDDTILNWEGKEIS